MVHRGFSVALSIVLGVFLLSAAPAARAVVATLYVGPGGGTGNCASPVYDTDGSDDNLVIQQAIDAAAAHDTVYLCAGDYDITTQLSVGKEITVAGSTSGALSSLTAGGANRIMGISAPATIDHLVFADAAMIDDWGAAIYVNTPNATIQHCSFTDNSTNQLGGAIYADGGLTVTDSLFSGNEAANGGAIFAGEWSPGAVVITGSFFTENIASTTGGAIYVMAPLFVTDGFFTDNIASSSGGAIYAMDSVSVSEGEFTGNEADYGGGAIHADSGTATTVVRSTFSANKATAAGSGGGAILADELFVSNSTFTANTAKESGGAISATDAVFTAVDFTKNRAGTGGAVALRSLDATPWRSNTFTKNVATTRAYGDSAAGAIIIADCSHSNAWRLRKVASLKRLAFFKRNIFKKNRAPGAAKDVAYVCMM
jgi:predicted outer membrane repeat protein